MSEESPASDVNDEVAREDVEALEDLNEAYSEIKSEIGNVIVGQKKVVDQLLLAIFSRGHCILEGVPGLGKTLMVSTLSQALNVTFSRIQFTPDLMPSDIVGTEVLHEDKSSGERVFKFLAGPVFSNIVLADEINRTPPKTQAALLESMQERQVTVGGEKHPLPAPFFVLATQNPIEQEGTYPLPEAQQDRFMFKIIVDYPDFDEEYTIAETTTATFEPDVEPVMTGEDILEYQKIIRRVPVAPQVIRYALRLVRATRVTEADVPQFIQDWVAWGAGPRAVQYLLLAGKARAALHGKTYVSNEDIKAAAYPVLRHRILTNFAAESEGITPDRVVHELLETISEKDDPDAAISDEARAALRDE
ncbi:MAG: MoxR family ATPase [Planctomycetes bacterium]|nr:MoxR family ATPase [Planctomycetota bacterium]